MSVKSKVESDDDDVDDGRLTGIATLDSISCITGGVGAGTGATTLGSWIIFTSAQFQNCL